MSRQILSKMWTGMAARRGLVWAAAAIALGGYMFMALAPGSTPMSAQAQTAGETSAASSSFSDSQKSEIETIVRSYLLKNPKLFLEIEQELKKLIAAEEAMEMKKSIAKNADFLFRRTNAPMAGNPQGDIPVVEFFDYNCGYCKRSFKDISDLIAKDPNVKVLLMEYPILSKGSLEASKIALAARNQGKYWELHQALLSYRGGGIDGKVALKLAKDLGLDVAKLKTDMESSEVKEEIEKVQALAQSMGINGTPHFLVGDRNIPGAPKNLLDQIMRNVAELRKEGCNVC